MTPADAIAAVLLFPLVFAGGVAWERFLRRVRIDALHHYRHARRHARLARTTREGHSR